MKTRFSSLVRVKKNIMQKSELVVQTANNNLQNAKNALESTQSQLLNIAMPSRGKITELFASRALLESQRAVIKHNEEWVTFAQNALHKAKQKLKLDTIEYEKFKHLELQEINATLKKIKIKEAKDLDEIALMTFAKNNEFGVAS